jgi:hypothetical protein
MSSVPDQREQQNGGESKNAHFDHAAQLARMGQVFRGRRDDILDYGGDEYDT